MNFTVPLSLRRYLLCALYTNCRNISIVFVSEINVILLHASMIVSILAVSFVMHSHLCRSLICTQDKCATNNCFCYLEQTRKIHTKKENTLCRDEAINSHNNRCINLRVKKYFIFMIFFCCCFLLFSWFIIVQGNLAFANIVRMPTLEFMNENTDYNSELWLYLFYIVWNSKAACSSTNTVKKTFESHAFALLFIILMPFSNFARS